MNFLVPKPVASCVGVGGEGVDGRALHSPPLRAGPKRWGLRAADPADLLRLWGSPMWSAHQKADESLHRLLRKGVYISTKECLPGEMFMSQHCCLTTLLIPPANQRKGNKQRSQEHHKPDSQCPLCLWVKWTTRNKECQGFPKLRDFFFLI